MGMYNPDPYIDGVSCGPGVTKQSFRDECDINKIVARFEKTGMIENLNSRTPFFGDVSELIGYHAALNLIKQADELFMNLSPEIRERFENDPGKMIAFLNDESNEKEAIELGIVNKKPEILPDSFLDKK